MHHKAKMARVESTISDLDELRATWPVLTDRERISAFNALPRDLADDFFLDLETRDQCKILLDLPDWGETPMDTTVGTR